MCKNIITKVLKKIFLMGKWGFCKNSLFFIPRLTFLLPYQRKFFFPAQMFYFVFFFQSVVFAVKFFYINNFLGLVRSCIFCAPAFKVLAKTFLNIARNAAVERVISGLQDVNVIFHPTPPKLLCNFPALQGTVCILRHL